MTPPKNIVTQTSEQEFCLRVPSNHPLATMLQGWLIGHEAINYLEPRGYDVADLKARFDFFPKPKVVEKQLRHMSAALKRQQRSAKFLANDPMLTNDPTWYGGLADESGVVEMFLSQLRCLLESNS